MKKHLLIIVIIATISSCSIPKYTHYYKSVRSLNLISGTWLINTSECSDLRYKHDLEKFVVEKLHKLKLDSVETTSNSYLKYIPQDRMIFKPSQETLALLKMTTKLDYLMNIRTQITSDELIGLIPEKHIGGGRNASEVEIIVYYIKTGEIVYDHKIIAKTEIDKSNKNVLMSKSAQGLIYSSINKAFKNIEKYSIAR